MDGDKAVYNSTLSRKTQNIHSHNMSCNFAQSCKFQIFKFKIKFSHSVKAGTNRQEFYLNTYFLLIHNRPLHL